MKYHNLLQLRVLHGGAPSAALRIAPRSWDVDGALAVARARWIVRPRPDGLDVAGPVADPDAPPPPALSFDVFVADPVCAHYTTFGVRAPESLPVYRNVGGASGELALATRALAPGAAARPARDVAAGIEIGGIVPAWRDAPRTFSLTLPVRETVRAYYVITSASNADRLRISERGAGPSIGFTPRLLAPSECEDPFGAELAARHPARTCVRFLSARPVACAPDPGRRLDLCVDAEPLLTGLPLPSHANQTSIHISPTEPAASVWFHVVRI